MERVMKSKLLNPLQEKMNCVCSGSIDLLAQHANSVCYNSIKDWFSDFILMYALTVASGNDTYIKTSKTVFDSYVTPACEIRSNCGDISVGLSDMISLLNA